MDHIFCNSQTSLTYSVTSSVALFVFLLCCYVIQCYVICTIVQIASFRVLDDHQIHYQHVFFQRLFIIIHYKNLGIEQIL